MDLSNPRLSDVLMLGGGEVLWHDTERAFCKLPRVGAQCDLHAFVPLPSGAEHPTLGSINRLAHEYRLKDHLDSAWALRPIELVREQGRTLLLVEYVGASRWTA